MRLDVAGFYSERTLVAVQRIIEAFELRERVAVIVVHLRVTGICRNRASKPGSRLFCAPHPRRDDAQQIQRVEVILSCCQYPSTPPLRLGPLGTGICLCCVLHGLRGGNRRSIAAGARLVHKSIMPICPTVLKSQGPYDLMGPAAASTPRVSARRGSAGNRRSSQWSCADRPRGACLAATGAPPWSARCPAGAAADRPAAARGARF